MEDERREFIGSGILRLETIAITRGPNASRERAFYSRFFDVIAVETVPFSLNLGSEAERLAGVYGLTAADALHVAAALLGNASELITAEKLSKPMHSVREGNLRVRSLLTL